MANTAMVTSLLEIANRLQKEGGAEGGHSSKVHKPEDKSTQGLFCDVSRAQAWGFSMW